MLEARPGEPLLEHLVRVAELAERWAPPQLKAEARIAGRVHDLFKATPWFQRYLHAPPKEQAQLKAQYGERLHHAWAGAVFGAFVSAQRGHDALAVFLAVACHHGHLKTPTALLPNKRDLLTGRFTRLDALEAQIQAVLGWEEGAKLLEALDLKAAFLEFARTDKPRFLNDLRQRFAVTRGRYWAVTWLFSALIDADKHLAAGTPSPERVPLPERVPEPFLNEVKRGAPIDPLRERLYRAVQQRIREAPLDHLFPAALTLTAPTGAGKTLTLLNAALELRTRVQAERGHTPRIVYALPYINLIEQNHAVFEAAMRHAGIPAEHALLAHHHLSEARDEDDLTETEHRLLLTESWEAELIVTTFVQVIETLYGTHNRTLKKLHRLLNHTILILDEVQALPAEHWPLLRRLLTEFVKHGNTVILATATQPALLQDALELAPHLPDWPTRVHIRRAETPPTTPPNRSRLIVANTVARSLELYAQQKALGGEVHYLSTNLTPHDRAQRIALLKQKLPHTPLTLVATPIVEAGLDLDFREGWRELGPVDAVIQVAGRINRSGNRPPEPLYLLPETNMARVYGRVLAELARSFFNTFTEGSDHALTAHLPPYFAALEARLASAQATGFIEAMTHHRFCRSGYPRRCRDGCGPTNPEGCDVCCFSLIQEEMIRIPIFIEQNDEASEALAELEAALKEPDPTRKRARLRRVRPKLARYTINPIARIAAKNLPSPLFGREDYRLVRREELEAYYDEETGFVWELKDQFL
ncbi:CRISPR-associated endonuclease Cas3'' [Marinithermus hydrothermalis]|uniref:Metal dependent phosphohydrolase n=1 Tax=Marinithermus hydrothermalis (strain DSM 14884 / JCM 11576 / T1) TaxID=869210 RepID=F2NN54_MARHT|nr:CRISPR-associated endonuclease Cas3'' [Marinithermus hydrothermalis]AEB12793.1 metal dependent phosphohydrolase [Marinithermus hydrothermalis DSM 14884]